MPRKKRISSRVCIASGHIQVTKTMSDDVVAERELRPLLEIRDNYPKMIISMDPEMPGDHSGIKTRNNQMVA